MPDADWCNKILLSIDELNRRPFLIADAGFMYAAKMSGNAKYFDLFTPDPGELAFLADEEAPHPFYTRGFLLQDESKVEELIKRAYKHENAAKYLLVKGRRDYIAKDGKILDIVSEPCIEALEPIGGTGDSLTGIVSALIDSGYETERACSLAAKINRVAGKLSKPEPSTDLGNHKIHSRCIWLTCMTLYAELPLLPVDHRADRVSHIVSMLLRIVFFLSLSRARL